MTMHRRNAKLGKWAMNVRSNFQFLQGKNNSVITEENLQQLQGIDFDFAPKNKKSHPNSTWIVGYITCRSFSSSNRRRVTVGSLIPPRQTKSWGAGSNTSVANTARARMVNLVR